MSRSGARRFLLLLAVLGCVALAPAELDARLQIVLLGDSTTICSVCRVACPTAPPLEEIIRASLAAEKDLPPVNVINLGRDGDYLQRLLEDGRYERDIVRLRRIDFVLIRYGLNDVNRREQFDVNFPRDLKILVAKLRADFPQATIVPVTNVPFLPDAAADAHVNALIAQVASDEQLPLFDLHTRYQREAQRRHDTLNYRRYPLSMIPVDRRASLTPFLHDDFVVIMDRRLDDRLGDLPGWFADRHPNLDGYRVIGHETAVFLAAQIRQRASQPATVEAVR